MAVSDFLAAYPFDEGSGTSAADVSGTHGAFDLTDSGASWATGVFGNAVRLQNVESVGAAFSPNIDLSGGYTVTFWFRTAQSASNQELLRTGPSAGPWNALVFEAWGDNQMYLGHMDSGSTFRQVGAGNYAGDVWRFFAVTWNSGTDTVQAWVGGPATPVSSAGTTGGGGGPGVASEVCYIGGNPGQNTINIVNGLLDELTFFDRVLSQSELDDLRVAGIPTGLAPPENVQAVAQSSTSILVTWNAVEDADAYDVERDSVIVADKIAATEFLDEGLTPETEYTYRVRSAAETT